MTYAKFDPEKYKHLQETLEQITNLEPGRSLTVKCIDAEHCSRTRTLLYGWLYHTSRSKYYTIYTEPPDLRVKKKGEAAPMVLNEKRVLPPHLDKIMQKLIISDEDPVKFLSELRKNGEITLAESLTLAETFENVMSGNS